ncbi:MAG: ChaB family protein [Acidimicrobiales bacterium]
MPGKKDMPSTIARSGGKAQRTWVKAHDSALDQYGSGERAQRVAYGALKHAHEKVGDHWEPKGHKGPSDQRSADPRAREKKGGTSTGGVDVLGQSKQDLMNKARKLDVKGRSSMNKTELAKEVSKANDRATARARAS